MDDDFRKYMLVNLPMAMSKFIAIRDGVYELKGVLLAILFFLLIIATAVVAHVWRHW